MASKFDAKKMTGMAALQNIAEKSNTMANSKVVLDLPISQIHPHPQNSKIYKVEKIEQLASSIESVGFFGAIDVYKESDGTYTVLSGHRRLEAMKFLGRERIPAMITAKPDKPWKVIQLLIQANRNSRDKSPMEVAREMDAWAETLKEQHGIDGENVKRVKGLDIKENVAEEFGLNKRTVQLYLKLLELIPELQELIDKNFVPWSSLCSAASLPSENQENIANAIKKVLKFMGDNVEDGTKSLAREDVERIVNDEKTAYESSLRKDTPVAPTTDDVLIELVNNKEPSEDKKVNEPFENEGINVEKPSEEVFSKELPRDEEIITPDVVTRLPEDDKFYDTAKMLKTDPWTAHEPKEPPKPFCVDESLVNAMDVLSDIERAAKCEIKNKEKVNELLQSLKKVIAKVESIEI